MWVEAAVTSPQTSSDACNLFIHKASAPLERIIMKRVKAEVLNVSSKRFFLPLKAPLTSEWFPGVVWTSYYMRKLLVTHGLEAKALHSTTVID